MTLVNSLKKKRFWIGVMLVLAVIAGGLGIVDYSGIRPQAMTTKGQITVKSTPYQGFKIHILKNNQDIAGGKVTDSIFGNLETGPPNKGGVIYQVSIDASAIIGVTVQYNDGNPAQSYTSPAPVVLMDTGRTAAVVTFTLLQDAGVVKPSGVKVKAVNSQTNISLGGVSVDVNPASQPGKWYNKGTTTVDPAANQYLVISLDPGQYNIRGTKTCFNSATNSVVVTSGAYSESILKLSPIANCQAPTGTLQINVRGDPWAGIQGNRRTVIFIDGKKADEQNRFNVSKTVQLEEGSHVVKVEISIITTAKIIDQAGDIVNEIPFVGGEVKQAVRFLGRLGKKVKPPTRKKPPQTKTVIIVANQTKTLDFQF